MGRVLKQAAEYREHAADCRKLAQTARNEMERTQLMQMAAAWERMAADREEQLNRDGLRNQETSRESAREWRGND